MDLEEGHPDVEAERPVCGERHESGVRPQLAVTLIEEHDVLLHLLADEPEWPFRHRRRLADRKAAVDAEKPVVPVPATALAREAHVLRVGGRQLLHEHEHRIPRGRNHVRQALQSRRVGAQDARALGELAQVGVIDVDGMLTPGAGRRRARN